MAEDRSEYRSEKGIASWWSKDGYWHVARPHVPTEEDRRVFYSTYPPGNDGPFYRWTDESFDTREEAIAALVGAEDRP